MTVAIAFTLFTVGLSWSRKPARLVPPSAPGSFFLIVPGPESPVASAEPDGGEGNTVDFYGNDVTSAIATYKLDRSGSLYEEHSPRTELPRLAPPEA